MPEPVAGRPYMPGYGITPAEEGKDVLPWSWAEERLSKAHNYWVATTNADGSPQMTAVWGVWQNQTFTFSCSPTSRKALNLAANPSCVVSTERADEAVIVEGVAADVVDGELLQAFKDAYDPKYDWKIEIDKGGIYVVKPKKAFAFIEHSDKFESTATRWTFT